MHIFINCDNIVALSIACIVDFYEDVESGLKSKNVVK